MKNPLALGLVLLGSLAMGGGEREAHTSHDGEPRDSFSFFPAFSICSYIWGALDPHTDGIVNAKKKGSESNVPTSLAGNAYHPHDGWRCPG
jgi:hypothetical protein